jgi:hypothetical protein
VRIEGIDVGAPAIAGARAHELRRRYAPLPGNLTVRRTCASSR